MYRKIVENFRRQLGNFQPPIQNQTPETGDTSRTENTSSPTEQANEQEVNQVPNNESENIVGTGEEQFTNFPVDPNDSFKIYENDHIEVFIQKVIHQRHKRFQLQDFLYNVKIKVKNGEHMPLLKDLFDVLKEYMYFIV